MKEKRIMSLFFCCCLLLPGLLYAQSSKTVTLDLKEVPVKVFFDAIRKQTGLSFVYNTEQTKVMGPITVSANNETVDAVLRTVFAGTEFSYQVEDKIVTIVKKEKPVGGGKIIPEIKGRVMAVEGSEAIIGASIVVEGTTMGTTTDLDGNFILTKIPAGSYIKVSYIGMVPQRLQVSGDMRIMMRTDSKSLKEVVVTGIVTKQKESFTGSSASFTGEELKSVGVQNPIASLKSLDPSFNVLENSTFGSDPNHMPDVEIRGKSSVLGMRDELSEDPNQPLFILDGFESTLSAIYNLDINRIASMTILKDAASTAIYGSKAANGVVVVETIKPKAGKLQLSYNGSMEVSFPDLSSYNLMNSREKLEFEKLAGKYESTGSMAAILALNNFYNQRLADVNSGVDTYWLAEPLRTGINQRHSLYAEGGSEGYMFGLGLNYNGINGVMKKSDRDVLGGQLDFIYRVGSLQFTNKFSAQQTTSANPIVPFSTYAAANPYYKKYNEEGGVDKYLANSDYEKRVPNPLYNESLNSRNEAKDVLLSDYFIAEYSPVKELKVRARFGLTVNTTESELFYSPDDTQFEEFDVLRKGSYTYRNTKKNKYEGELTAIYATVLKDIHRINLAAGGNMAEQKTTVQGYSAEGFPSGDFTYPSFSNGYTNGGRPTYTESLYRTTSAYLIAGYSLDNRYLMDASYRLNGSSVFGTSKQFINTWSVGLGWNIHNEKWIQEHFPFINFFKIRGSIGNPGNQNFDSSASLTTFRYAYSSYNYYGLGSTLDVLGNQNLKWQTTLDRNIGLDLTLFDNRLVFNLDYYYKTTDPLLISIGLPSSSGVPETLISDQYLSAYYTNLGRQISKGFTGIAQYYIFRDFDRRLTWSLRGTIRMESSKLDGLGNVLESLNNYGQSRSTRRFYDGADPDDIWAVRSAGIDPATGRELFIKKDGTRTFDFSYDDEVVVGNTRPDMEGTIGSNFGYKGFTVGATFRYRLGGDVFNKAVYSKVENVSSSSLIYNMDKRALYDRWQQAGDVAQFKNIANSSSTPMSSRFVQKENTLTFESFQIGYEFNPVLMKKLGIGGLRLNAYMNDIFRLSTIKSERGTDYPYAKSVTFALSFTL